MIELIYHTIHYNAVMSEITCFSALKLFCVFTFIHEGGFFDTVGWIYYIIQLLILGQNQFIPTVTLAHF